MFQTDGPWLIQFQGRLCQNEFITFITVAQWATIAHVGASIMFGVIIIYDAQRQVYSELETVIRKKFKQSRYCASSGYLQVLKRPE